MANNELQFPAIDTSGARNFGLGNLNTNVSMENILKLLQTPRKSYTETVFPSVLPLLTPQEGLPAETQEAIGNIQTMGQEGIRTAMGNVGTAMQRRGLTGSSIEAGALGETARRGEMDILSQINPLIANAAQQKIDQRNNLANFLSTSYGIDFGGQTDLLDKLAQLMSDDLSRQADLNIANRTADANKSAGQIGAIGNIIGGLFSGGLF